jgi:repressor LexA
LRAVTQAQLRVLRLLADLTRSNGYPPTWREMLAAEGHTSLNGIHGHMVALERKGMLKRAGMRTRSHVLTELGHELLGWKRCDCGAWRPE